MKLKIRVMKIALSKSWHSIALCILGCGLIHMSPACKPTDKTDRPTLSVSIEPQRKMLESIVGDKYSVVTLLAKGANPETYDPSVQQKLDANKSLAYFSTGYLPFEETLGRELSDRVKLVNTSAGIQAVTGTHSHGEDISTETDPHVWSSFANARIMAGNMADAMCDIDPANATFYRTNANRLASSIDSMQTVADSLLQAAHAHAFAIWHPSLSYFARDHSLHQLALGQESKEASIANLKSLIDEARHDSVKVFFFQKEFDSRQAGTISNEIGSRLVPINPLAYDWDTELINIVNELTH